MPTSKTTKPKGASPKRAAPKPRAKKTTKPKPINVTCCVRNLHLGDGRVLSHGDKAIVDPDLAALLSQHGQVLKAV